MGTVDSSTPSHPHMLGSAMTTAATAALTHREPELLR
jgi:hypothetical protein